MSTLEKIQIKAVKKPPVYSTELQIKIQTLAAEMAAFLIGLHNQILEKNRQKNLEVQVSESNNKAD